jgi:phosphopantetheine adenylyltransferase
MRVEKGFVPLELYVMPLLLSKYLRDMTESTGKVSSTEIRRLLSDNTW